MKDNYEKLKKFIHSLLAIMLEELAEAASKFGFVRNDNLEDQDKSSSFSVITITLHKYTHLWQQIQYDFMNARLFLNIEVFLIFSRKCTVSE